MKCPKCNCTKISISKGMILDPLADSCTTAVVAKRMGRPYIMIDIDFEKVLAAKARLGEK